MTSIQDDAITGVSDYQSSDGNAAQYWRELSRSLRMFPQFDGAARPQDIITQLNGVVSEVERLGKQLQLYDVLMEQKDHEIEDKEDSIKKFQKRNASLTKMLQGQVNQGRESSSLHRGSKIYCSSNSDASFSSSGDDQKEGVDLEKKYNQLVESKNTLYGHWKTVSVERDTYKDKLQSTQTECNRLKQQVECQSCASVSNSAVGDKEVMLMRDENGRCGIKFGCPKKTPLLMESNTIITDVKPGIPNYMQLSIGDFVIEVNGRNIQWLKLREVLELVNTAGDLKLKLRPSRHNTAKAEKALNGHKSLTDWGLTFGVYVKEAKSGGFADTSGMHEMDELIKVNSNDVYDLSLKKINNLMNKEVKFRYLKLQNPYDIYAQSSPQSSYGSRPRGSSSPPSSYGGSRPPSSYDGSRPRGSSSLNPTALPPGIQRQSDNKSVSSDHSSNKSNNSDSRRGSIIPEIVPNVQKLSDTSPFSDSSGELSPQSSGGPTSDEFRSTDSNIVTCVVNKSHYEAYGWSLIGGNKVGIYVKAVDNWSPIEKAEIGVGWKILQINNTRMEDVAFTFALDFMTSLRQSTSITVKLEKYTRELYSAQISKKPYDNFHIRTMVDYKKKSSDESSFKTGETYCVTDSYYISDNNVLKWFAKNTSTSQTVTIPSQKANFILNDEENYSSSRDKRNLPVKYYAILDRVDVGDDKENEEDNEEGEF